MLLSTSTNVLAKAFSHKDAIRIIKESGFDAFDMSLCEMLTNKDSIFNTDDYLNYANELRAYADSIGIVCNQAHAPFHSSTGKPDEDEEIFQKIVRSMEIASVLGARVIIVHPKQHLKHAEFADEHFEMNVQFYTRLASYAEKFGIKVATENMWQYNKNTWQIIDAPCSRPREFCKYVDAINSKWIVACFDIGHAALVGENIPDFIRKLGNRRLQALHVSDNEFLTDAHKLPFEQKIDFVEVAKVLAEIGYEGDFTFEADGTYKQRPKELYKASATYMAEVGRYLIAEIEKAKSNI